MESVNFTGESKRKGIKVSKVSFNHPIIRKKRTNVKSRNLFFRYLGRVADGPESEFATPITPYPPI